MNITKLKRRIPKCGAGILSAFAIIICILAVSSASGIEPQNDAQAKVESIFGGRWRTQSGSVYQLSKGAMVCLFVHDRRYEKWKYKSALQNFQLKEDGWFADHVFRYLSNGRISKLKTAKITLMDDSTFKTQVIASTGEPDPCCKPRIWKKIP